MPPLPDMKRIAQNLKYINRKNPGKGGIVKINGIGTMKKEKAMEILTDEGRKAVKNGEITTEELGEMYKLEMVKKASKIGSMQETFSACYKWIPEELKEELSPESLGKLTDQFYACYGAGKSAR